MVGGLKRSERALAGASVLIIMLGGFAITARGEDTVNATVVAPPEVVPAATGAPSPAAAEHPVTPAPEPARAGVAVPRTAIVVRAAPDGAAPVTSRLRAGIPLPISASRGRFLAVQTPCQLEGWVAESEVRVLPPASGRARRLDDATIVLDAGHGGIATGAVGPSGYPEKDANAAIIGMLEGMLAPARVLLTRPGDHDAGLAYRAAIANASNADLFLSLHNNAAPDGPSERPGTETYFQSRSADSKRIAGLTYEEVVSALDRFEGVAWTAERDAGAKFRLNQSGGDYYGLLRRTTVPAVLVEATFISNGPEEMLLRTADAQRAIAEALARSVRRYLSTDDPGSGFVEPYPRQGGPSGVLPSACADPA